MGKFPSVMKMREGFWFGLHPYFSCNSFIIYINSYVFGDVFKQEETLAVVLLGECLFLCCAGLAGGLLSGTSATALLLDAGSLTSELAQIVKLSATNLTNLVHFDALDVGRLQGEDTLYTHGARHLTNCEALLLLMTADLDDHATEELDALLGTLDNFVSPLLQVRDR